MRGKEEGKERKGEVRERKVSKEWKKENRERVGRGKDERGWKDRG